MQNINLEYSIPPFQIFASIVGCFTVGKTSSGSLNIESQKSVTGDGFHWSGHRFATSERPRSQTRKRHVRHSTHLRFQDCALRAKVRVFRLFLAIFSYELRRLLGWKTLTSQLLKFNYAYRVSELLDYTAEELTGQSLYSLCHGEDVHKLRRTHEDRKRSICYLLRQT